MKKLDKSKLVMSLAKKEKLVPYLDKAIQEFDEPFKFDYEPKRGDNVPAWHPSGDCTPTVEQLYTQATKTLDDEAPRLILPQKAMMVGHYWHQFLQHIVLHKLEFCEPKAIERRGNRWWGDPVTPAMVAAPGLNNHEPSGYFEDKYRKEDLYFLRYPEQEAERKGDYGSFLEHWPEDDLGVALYQPQPYHWATGSGDIAPIELPRGWKGIVDFKTMGSGSFKQLALPEMFAAKYECQVNIYMDFFEEEQAMLLCINKDTPHDFKEICFVRNQPLINAIYSKWRFVSECISEGHAPLTVEEVPLPISGPYEGT